MASNKANQSTASAQQTHPAQPTQSTQSTQSSQIEQATQPAQSEEVRAIIMEAARVQLAALNAGIAFWSGWVDSAAKFAEEVNRELASVADTSTDTDAGELVGRLTDSSREYLRRMTELPNIAVDRFNADLSIARAPARKGKRTRAARAKL